MQFKHSLSIFGVNLALSYKVLILIFIVVIIASALFVSIFNPLIAGIKEALELEGITLSATEILNEPVEQLTKIWNTATEFLSDNYALLVSRFLFLALLMVFARFFISLAFLPISKILYDKMTTGYSGGLFQSLVATLPQTIAYAFFSSLIYSLLDIGIFFLSLWLLLFLYKIIKVSALLPTFTIFLLLFTARIALFSHWLPIVCDGTKNIFKALSQSFKSSLKSFGTYFPMALTMTIVYASIIITFLLTTFGLLPIVTFPMYMIFICIFNNVSYFNFKKRKYYTDEGITVYTPKSNK